MEDVLFEVFTFLKCQDVIINMHMCKMCYKAGKSQFIWKHFVFKKYQTKFYNLSWFDTYRICYKLINNLEWNGTFNELINKQNVSITHRLCAIQKHAIPNEIVILSNITELDFCYNEFFKMPTAIFQLTNLRKLHLVCNGIKNIPKEISQLTNLRLLGLHYNHITCIPSEIGFLVKLKTLYLDNNEITYVPTDICKLTNLTTLHLQYNKITHIPDEIKQLKQLTKLTDIRLYMKSCSIYECMFH